MRKENTIEKDIPNIMIVFTLIIFFGLYFQSLHLEQSLKDKVDNVYNKVGTMITLYNNQEAELERLKQEIQKRDTEIVNLNERLDKVSKFETILKDLERSWKRR